MTKWAFLFLLLATTLPAADFARDIQPILHARCAACHGVDKPQGGLSVYTRSALLKGGVHGPAITPGSSGKSLLIARVTHGTPAGTPRMPLGQSPLTGDEIATLRAWIDAGAEWNPNGQPLQGRVSTRPRRPAIPHSARTHPIDAFLDRYWRQMKVAPAAPISDATFARRVYLDLIGLPPTPEEQAAFANDQRPGRRDRLIYELLAGRRRYAEHWMTFWNDLLRNEDGVAYPGETREWITGWLLQALETNMPYDRMARALLDPSEKDSPRGFLAGINWGGDVSASQSVPMQAAQNSAQVFLGASLKCASCHDSFVSHWRVAETFSLAAFFSAAPLEIARCEVKTGATANPAFLFPELEKLEPAREGITNRARVAALFTSPHNGRFARTLVNRYWRSLFGRGLVEPVDDMDAPAWDADLLDWLAADFADHDYDLQFLLRRILTSRAYQSAASAESETSVRPLPGASAGSTFRGPLTRRLTAEQFTDAVAAITGEWKVYDRQTGKPATYERQWRFRSDPLTRALGRADRGQVITERSSEATTLQALELVNGKSFAQQLRRGAQRLLGQISPSTENIFDSGMVRANTVDVDIDISGAPQLWLAIEDVGSYHPPSVVAGWMDAELSGPQGTIKLTDLPMPAGSSARMLRIKDAPKPRSALTGRAPWRASFDLKDKNHTRFRATVGVDEASLRSETNARMRFFVFTREPRAGTLARVAASTPAPPPPVLEGDALASRLFRYVLARDPVPEERRKALELMQQGAAGLEDLLWILFLSPEFQLIR